MYARTSGVLTPLARSRSDAMSSRNPRVGRKNRSLEIFAIQPPRMLWRTTARPPVPGSVTANTGALPTSGTASG
jgi:hypothetical protein